MQKKAIIIGAGPAGLTAAFELLKRTDIIPVILEKSGDIGGISKTINYKGNRMDMGPHRFFSKSDRVMAWWLNILPLQQQKQDQLTIHYQNKSRTISSEPDLKKEIRGRNRDHVMIVIQRLTRIYYLRNFFAYPLQLSLETLRIFGISKTLRILFSYLQVRLLPRKPENSLEDFIINKFGKELYNLFFKDYTEKVWGVPCSAIPAEWGAQRIKGVSLQKAVVHAIQSVLKKKSDKIDLEGKSVETSLIEQFLYPKHGAGQLWEEVASQIKEMGGIIEMNQDVTHIHASALITGLETKNSLTGQTMLWEGEYFFSSMPVQELIRGMGEIVPGEVREVAEGLQYRDFINVGILLKKFSRPDTANGQSKQIFLKDNWIYIQERDVKVGRLMIYNNWGDGMVSNPETLWLGMEYFCAKDDAFWKLEDSEIAQIAKEELVRMELAAFDDILDFTVVRLEKTYPAYFGTFNRFGVVSEYTDTFKNLFLIGRNGMHKYNNADHSMLTAMISVDNIQAGITDKSNIWAVNTEQAYHEENSKS